MNQPQVIYRQDYTPSAYLIQTTTLKFEFLFDCVEVSSELICYQNPKADKSCELFLNGEQLELLTISLNGDTPNYKLVEQGLWLYELPKTFLLKIKVKLYPQSNTSLNGLYQSGGMFCTQCEAHGFRRITYYLDRPDVLSRWQVNIVADKTLYPTQLSNGDLVNNQWLDPHPKPCYLFALVVGDLVCTQAKHQQISLEIYTEKHNAHKTEFAIQSLKRAMDWDQERFGLFYDLNTYMIVAVDDFNMGAMENKGLNIFNSTYVLADSKTATDENFMDVEAVIGHEYFHNWTGNRITCQDWFQLSLKEGLTVFRDQEFSADLHSRSIKRIEDVERLRRYQFAEDSGPMAHPVRPESYIEMNNFYTATVYEKGAELVRMLHTLLGEQTFQQGIRRYVEKFDGKAVSIDDFVQVMSEISKLDLSDFMPWYQCAGTPTLKIENKQNHLYITQDDKRLTPIKYAILSAQGKELDIGVLSLKEKNQVFDFSNFPKDCVFSCLQNFSAPVHLKIARTSQERIFLLKYDQDAFSRWDNAQQLYQTLIFNSEQIDKTEFFSALKVVVENTSDKALVSKLLTLPSEQYLQQIKAPIDVFFIHQKVWQLQGEISQYFEKTFLDIYQQLNHSKPYVFDAKHNADRALKNKCLFYLSRMGHFDLVYQQFKQANNMTDKFCAFECLLNHKETDKEKILEGFYQEFSNDTQVMDKFFAVQMRTKTATVETAEALMQHPLFTFNNPNRLRSVVWGFAQNYANFHCQAGYAFLTRIIIQLNHSNPQIGARLVSIYNHWRRFTPELSALQQQQLEKILKVEKLSNDIFEIVKAALK
jgi:aminopeptidase N